MIVLYWNVYRPNGEWLCTLASEQDAFALARILNIHRMPSVRWNGDYYVAHTRVGL